MKVFAIEFTDAVWAEELQFHDQVTTDKEYESANKKNMRGPRVRYFSEQRTIWMFPLFIKKESNRVLNCKLNKTYRSALIIRVPMIFIWVVNVSPVMLRRSLSGRPLTQSPQASGLTQWLDGWSSPEYTWGLWFETSNVEIIHISFQRSRPLLVKVANVRWSTEGLKTHPTDLRMLRQPNIKDTSYSSQSHCQASVTRWPRVAKKF